MYEYRIDNMIIIHAYYIIGVDVKIDNFLLSEKR